MSVTKTKYDSLAQENKEDIIKKETFTDEKLDSVKKNLDKKMKNYFIQIPEETRKSILAEVEKRAKDTSKTKTQNGAFNFSFGKGTTRLDKFVNYQKNTQIQILILL